MSSPTTKSVKKLASRSNSRPSTTSSARKRVAPSKSSRLKPATKRSPAGKAPARKATKSRATKTKKSRATKTKNKPSTTSLKSRGAGAKGKKTAKQRLVTKTTTRKKSPVHISSRVSQADLNRPPNVHLRARRQHGKLQRVGLQRQRRVGLRRQRISLVQLR